MQTAELTTSILNTLPLNVSTRRRLRGELSAVQGSIDLMTATSLRVVSPVFRTGAPAGKAIAAPGNVSAGANGGLEVELKANPDLIGYEVAWYDVKKRDDGPGLRIVPREAETHIGGAVEKGLTPRVNRLDTDPAARWFRYFVMTRASRNDYNIAVLAGRTKGELESRSEAFRKDAALYLESAPKASYAAMTGEIGVNPYVRVKINGVEVDIAMGSSLGQAIGGAGATQLTVLKPHVRGLALVEAEREVLLNLPLEGGEEITWH
jgi:hypothetical protein